MRGGAPKRAAPFVLEDQEEVTPLDEEAVEARILWRHPQISLYLLQRRPQPGCSRAERPLGMLLDVMCFPMVDAGRRWSRWTPPAI